MDKLITVQGYNYQITTRISTLLQMPEFTHLQQVCTHYEPGNVVYSSYWHSYDLVISLNIPGKEWGDWSVTVITCDSKGKILDGAKEREHCTMPDKNDRVEFNKDKLRQWHKEHNSVFE